MFREIKSILPKSIRRAGIGRQVQDTLIIKLFNEIKEKLLITASSEKIRPVYAKGGVLVIASLSSSATKELQTKEKEIINEINNNFKKRVINKIKCIT